MKKGVSPSVELYVACDVVSQSTNFYQCGMEGVMTTSCIMVSPTLL